MLKRRRINEEHGFLPYDYYAGYDLEGQELFDAVRIGDEMWEVGTAKVAASSSGTRRFTVADRTAKRIYITDGYLNYTITPNTVENDLFYYKHFNTKHYLSWVSKSLGMSRPDKPKKSTTELPGKRKSLSNTELSSSRWFGGLLPDGYASITEGHFIYYSKTDEMDDLVLLVGGQIIAKIPVNTPMSDPDSILQDVKFVTSLDQFNPLKSTKQRDWLGVDFDALDDVNYVYGGFSEKCFKSMKKFFKADPSQIKVGLAKKDRKFFLVLFTQDKNEVGMIILNPLNAFEGRKRFESVSLCRKIRGTYSSRHIRRLYEGTGKGLGLASYMESKFGYVRSEIEEWGGSIPDTLKLYVESDQFGQWDMMVGEASGRYMFSVGVRVAHDPYGGYRVYIGFPYELDDQHFEEEFPEEERQEAVDFAVELFTTACIDEMFAPEEVYWK